MDIDSDHILPDSPTLLVDKRALFETGLRRSAAKFQAEAVLAWVDMRHQQILADLLKTEWPDYPLTSVDKAVVDFEKILKDRLDKARRLRKRAGDLTDEQLVDLADARPTLALELQNTQAAQVDLDEQAANLDIYAISTVELIRTPRFPGMPQPRTAEAIRYEAISGRARMRAIEEALDAHRDGGPIPEGPHHLPEAQMQLAAARKYYGLDDEKAGVVAETEVSPL